jgi:hypothetical protein
VCVQEKNPELTIWFLVNTHGGTKMKSHMDGEVKWVWILTSLAILYIVSLYAN